MQKNTKVVLLLGSILILGLALRLIDLGQPFIGDKSWDEVHYAIIAQNFSRYGLLDQYSQYGLDYTSTPLTPWLIYLGMQAFGNVEWAIRLPFVIISIFTLVIVYFLAAKLYNSTVGLVATFLAAIAPGLVFYGRASILDVPMTAAGLTSVLALLSFRRPTNTTRIRIRRAHHWGWLFLACLSLAIAILFKFTAVLFVPALGWVWFMEGVRKNGKRYKSLGSWIGFALFTLLACLPALSWLVWARLNDPRRIENHLFRFEELRLIYLKNLVLSEVGAFPAFIGSILAYTLIFLLPFLLAIGWGRYRFLLRRHAVTLLLSSSWFFQMVFPRSWAVNEYYHYAPTWGLSILFAVILLKILNWLRDEIKLEERTWLIAATSLIVIVFCSNMIDYHRVFHASYYPWGTIVGARQFSGARLVAARNTDQKPVLTDVLQTQYYAGADPHYISYKWWGDSDGTVFIQELEKINPQFVVMSYLAQPSILEALERNSYLPLAPGVWEKP